MLGHERQQLVKKARKRKRLLEAHEKELKKYIIAMPLVLQEIMHETYL
jgi:hypothetical protein